MSSDKIIHFKTAKKKAAHRNKEAQAAQNRIKFGRTKAQKNQDKLRGVKAKQQLDGHELSEPIVPITPPHKADSTDEDV